MPSQQVYYKVHSIDLHFSDRIFIHNLAHMLRNKVILWIWSFTEQINNIQSFGFRQIMHLYVALKYSINNVPKVSIPIKTVPKCKISSLMFTWLRTMYRIISWTPVGTVHNLVLSSLSQVSQWDRCHDPETEHVFLPGYFSASPEYGITTFIPFTNKMTHRSNTFSQGKMLYHL